jgi:hypothetical protein
MAQDRGLELPEEGRRLQPQLVPQHAARPSQFCPQGGGGGQVEATQLVADGVVRGLEDDQLGEEGAQGLVRAGLLQQRPGAPDNRFEQAGHRGVQQRVLAAEGAHDGPRAQAGLRGDGLGRERGARLGQQRRGRLQGEPSVPGQVT